MANIGWKVTSAAGGVYFLNPVIEGTSDVVELPTDYNFTSLRVGSIYLSTARPSNNTSSSTVSYIINGVWTTLGSLSSSTGSSMRVNSTATTANLTAINDAIAAGTFDGLRVSLHNTATNYSANVALLEGAVTFDPTEANIVVETPVNYIATPATATATAVNPSFYGHRDNVSVAAVPATTTNSMGSASVTIVPLFQETRRVLAPAIVLDPVASNRAYAPAETIGVNNLTGRALYIAEVPGIAPGETLVSQKLYLEHKHGYAFRLYAYKADSLTDPYDAADPSIYSLLTDNDRVITLPNDVKFVRFGTVSTSTMEDWKLDSPAADSVNHTGSYFELSVWAPAPVTGDVNAEAATADAEMVNADVDTAAHVSIGALAFNSTVDMPGGHFPDAFTFANIVDGTAEMRTAWFRSDNTENPEPATALLEALDAVAGTDRNIVIEPLIINAFRSTLFLNPMEVDEDSIDAYFARVTGRATEGSTPTRPQTWLRLNERSGSTVYTTNPLTGAKTATGYALEGLAALGAPGPNNRRALSVVNAGINAFLPDSYQSAINGGSLEFTVRIEPGHTGRMDIANGTVASFSGSTGPQRRVHASVRDGRLYASTTYGGTSVQRIDDGKFHHIVITTSERTHAAKDDFIGSNHSLDLWIDGNLDRSLITEENRWDNRRNDDVRLFARPDHYLGQDTGYPFKGDILEISYRESFLRAHEITDLYLDLFGFKAIRAGAVTAGSAEMFQGAKVVSNMKRMLVLSWAIPNYPGLGLDLPRRDIYSYATAGPGMVGYHPRSINTMDNANSPVLSPMLGYGYDENMDIGRYRITHQSVQFIQASTQSHTAVKQDVVDAHLTADANPALRNVPFRDFQSGFQRLINLQTDVNLDDFEIITFQGYPNPVYKDQRERQMYEAFFNSVNTALADGQKIWLTDAFLAADLGWVSDVDEVPVFGRELAGVISGGNKHANDVRGYEVAPFIGLDGAVMDKPTDGSMPELPTDQPEGPFFGTQNLWSWDTHRNNGYRVVNEIEGLTDLPTWEVEESFLRNRMKMIPTDAEWHQSGYKIANRTGETFEWERFYEETDFRGGSTGKPRSTELTFQFTEPSEQRGLSAGDEFYDWIWFQQASGYYRKFGTNETFTTDLAITSRVVSTWAIPMGHLRLGTAVTTFRSTVWDDYGKEVSNPYRNHIRNAVVRPGDRLPDGRKVSGYAYMEFAEHPYFFAIAGVPTFKDETFGVGMNPIATSQGPDEPLSDVLATTVRVETPYSYEWDRLSFGRISYSGGGYANVTQQQVVMTYMKDSQGKVSTIFEEKALGGTGGMYNRDYATALPIAQDADSIHPQASLPHMTWNARGISWLTLVESDDAEVALAHGDVIAATGSMVSPMVDTDFDNVVTVQPASATARIVDPGETVVKSTNVLAFAATAGGTMNGLQGGYIAQAAMGLADMPQNVLRPLDIAEVLYFTLSFAQEPITLRMEEN